MINTRNAAGLGEDTNNTGSPVIANPLSASGLGGVVAEILLAEPPIILDF